MTTIPTAAERTAITAAAMEQAQRARLINEPNKYRRFWDLPRRESWSEAAIANLQGSFDLYPAGTDTARRIDDMIARNLFSSRDEVETLLELNAPHLFHAEVISGPPDTHTAFVIESGECDHRGAAICNAIGEHSFAHDGYADNADAYRAGWTLSGEAPEIEANARADRYYSTAGPDRTAFHAGWVARQRSRAAEAERRARASAEQEARNRAYLTDHATNQINDATNTLAALANHDEPCTYTLKSSTGLILDHLLTLIEAPAGTPEGDQERARCVHGHNLPARAERGAWLPLEAVARLCADCGKTYDPPTYYTTENGTLCPTCAGPFLDPDNADDPRRPAAPDAR